MTDKTATQNLTRTTATDDPKRVADYLKTLATEADQRMASHFRDLGRSTTPPFAVARLTIPRQIDANVTLPGSSFNGGLPFDTVEIDTAGMIDLSADPFSIYPPETGWYWVGGYALTTGFGSNAADAYAQVNFSGEVFRDMRHDGLLGFVGSGGSGQVRMSTVPSTRPAQLNVGWVGGSTTSITTVFFAELWVIKERDL